RRFRWQHRRRPGCGSAVAVERDHGDGSCLLQCLEPLRDRLWWLAVEMVCARRERPDLMRCWHLNLPLRRHAEKPEIRLCLELRCLGVLLLGFLVRHPATRCLRGLRAGDGFGPVARRGGSSPTVDWPWSGATAASSSELGFPRTGVPLVIVSLSKP